VKKRRDSAECVSPISRAAWGLPEPFENLELWRNSIIPAMKV
jgi:hypothetical protein